ncbi:flagellar hook-length control protein FliK [Bovifimicola ammoniilytica]|mgnify:FL=1|uniref:flagellar hook-length control protein FliK n=1 Tax=Bovifimicola ammoniilytica TaxID=2981720 RepID=UPI0008235038|nr:flagellar hook-length control protein FliK [Bovifimicola ammoniilytica]MCU6753271.1 flagellar hook-length control protein FliK [Bovifimicola ammoniilytica]SCJ58507.1 Flagellar hook-length control protein FliK [uncultured Eubacterium sp.]
MNINISNYYTDSQSASDAVSNSGSNRNEAVDRSVQNQNVQNINSQNNTGGINLRDLAAGDVFRGEIININNQNVEILLDGNEHINATMQQALGLNIGEKLLFQVKDNSDTQLVIRPIANNEVSSELVNKSLLTAGLTINDKNIAIVKELIANGQPIDKQSIINMIKLSSVYANESIDKLIDMTKNGIEINRENLDMYDAYTTSSHYISENIMEIGDGILEVFEKLLESDVNFSDFTENNVNIEDTTGNTTTNDITSGNFNENSINPENLMGNTISSDSFTKINTILEDLSNIFDADNDNKQISESINVDKNNIYNKESIQEASKESTKDFLKMIDSSDTFKELSEVLKNIGENMPKEAFNNIIKSPVFKEKITKLLMDRLYLNPTKLSEDKKIVKNEVDKIYDKLNKLTEMIKNMPENVKSENLSLAGDKLSKNMNFMNELNNIEAYVQVPVKFSEGNKNGDLYVYNRRRNKKINDDTLTAFLHLQLDYLGATDINISLKKNSVTAKFTLDDETSRNLVEDNLGELAERLEKIGYNVTISTELSEKKSQEFNAILPITSNNENAVSIKRYIFDIRT